MKFNSTQYMYLFGMSFLILILIISIFICKKRGEKEKINDKIMAIEELASNPQESFFYLSRIIEYEDFLRKNLHPSLKNYDSSSYIKEEELFLSNYVINEENSNGYFFASMEIIKSLGIYDLLDKSANAPLKTQPVLVVKNGFFSPYGKVCMDLLILEKYLYYAMVYELDHGNKQLFQSYMPKIINAEFIVNVAPENTLRFIEKMLERYEWSETEKKDLLLMVSTCKDMQKKHRMFLQRMKNVE